MWENSALSDAAPHLEIEQGLEYFDSKQSQKRNLNQKAPNSTFLRTTKKIGQYRTKLSRIVNESLKKRDRK